MTGPVTQAGGGPSTATQAATPQAHWPRDRDSLGSVLRDLVRVLLHPLTRRLPMRDGRRR
jgi:hypothetical protein